MKSSAIRQAPMLGVAIISGTLITLGLLLTINVLAHYRSHTIEPRPVLMVELSTWPTPAKPAEKPQPLKPQSSPSLKPTAKQIPAPIPELKPKPRPNPRPKPRPEPIKAPIKNPMEAITPPAENKPAPEASKALKAPTLTDLENNVAETPTQEAPAPPTKPSEALPTPVPFFKITNAPRFLHRETPVYPDAMRAVGVSGVVKLEALIDKQGRVRQVTILTSAGKQFDEAATHAIMASSFYPAEVDKKPVAVLLRLPVKFELL